METRTIGEALASLRYASYRAQRDGQPGIAATEWAVLFYDARELEARYQREREERRDEGDEGR